MKKKKILIIVLIMIIAIFVGVLFLVKKENPQINKDTNTIIDYNFEKYNLDGNEFVNVSFFGVEGNSFYSISYSEIPNIDNRINKVSETGEEYKLTLDDDEITSEQTFEEVISLLNAKEIEYCSFKEDTNGLKNGDIVQLDCDNAVLKKLGYTFEPTINIEVNGLSESIPEENYETESASETSEENEINIAYSPDEIPTDIKEDIFTYLDNVVLITPADLDNFEIKGDYSDKEVTMFVYSEENFEKAKEYALKNNNIDIIQYNNKEYLKEDDFSEGREGKGRSGGEVVK